MAPDGIIRDIFAAWVSEDKEKFKALVISALNQAFNKNDILMFFEKNRPADRPIDEDFEEWAYMLVVSEGTSDCAPG